MKDREFDNTFMSLNDIFIGYIYKTWNVLWIFKVNDE